MKVEFESDTVVTNGVLSKVHLTENDEEVKKTVDNIKLDPVDKNQPVEKNKNKTEKEGKYSGNNKQGPIVNKVVVPKADVRNENSERTCSEAEPRAEIMVMKDEETIRVTKVVKPRIYLK